MSYGAAGTNIPRSSSTGYNVRQAPNFTPQMQQLFEKLLGGVEGSGGLQGGLDYLSKLAGGDEEAFGEMEAPAYRAFQGLLGDIGSRFAGQGALGSSAFQNATSGAASQFAENLGAQRHGIQQGALDKLLGLSERLLNQRPYDNYLEPKDRGTDWMKLLGQLGGGALGSFGGPFLGAAGSQAGAKLLPWLSKFLGGK